MRWTRWIPAFAGMTGLVVLAAPHAFAADPDVLWKIINGECVPDAQRNGTPDPCLLVDLSAGVDKGYVVLKDLDGTTQLLVMPTAKITGIEDAAVLTPDATNYFAMAWLTTPRVAALAHRALPRDGLSLAANPINGRSQNQLHIHVDCLDAGVRDVLRQHAVEIGEQWAPLPVMLKGHQYQAMRIAGAWLEGKNPFRLLADAMPGASADMAHQTLAVVGATSPDGRPGFILIAGHVDGAVGVHWGAEELQDHTCQGY
jgi:CDP-diacylglycerol pyrophosphatase